MKITNPEVFAETPRIYLGASEVGGCSRKIKYRLNHARGVPGAVEPSERDLTTWLKLKSGNALEPLIVQAMAAAGFVLEGTGDDQTTVVLGKVISGHPDGHIVSHPAVEVGGRTVAADTYAGWSWECKTKASWPAKSFAKEGPNPYEYAQHAVYCAAKGCPGTLFTVFNMNTKELLHYAVAADPRQAGFCQGKAETIERLDLKDIAKEPVAKWECSYCDFRHDCGGV